jgi:hypothetical protein
MVILKLQKAFSHAAYLESAFGCNETKSSAPARPQGSQAGSTCGLAEKTFTIAACCRPLVYKHHVRQRNCKFQMEVYNHRPLEANRHQIRLLKVDRSLTVESKVQCHLEIFDLDSAPHYTALSYRWTYSKSGDAYGTTPETTEAEQFTLIVDGKLLHVSENLSDFLEVFHSDPKNEPVWLWIDQISINQTDVSERNQQVRLMSNIYTQCQAVIVWLGKASAPSAQRFWKDGPELLLQNSYFTRVWILQEVLLAKHFEVLGGTAWIDGSAFLRIPLTGHLVTAGVPITAVSLLDNLQTYRRDSATLAQMLLFMDNRECTDLRDQVYGLLGLVSEDQRPEIDYTKTLWEVFLDTVLTLCNALSDHHTFCAMVLSSLAMTFSNINDPQHPDLADFREPFDLTLLLLEMRQIAAGATFTNREIPPGPKDMIAIGTRDGQWWYEFLDQEGTKIRIYAEAQPRVSSKLANKLSWFNKYSR